MKKILITFVILGVPSTLLWFNSAELIKHFNQSAGRVEIVKSTDGKGGSGSRIVENATIPFETETRQTNALRVGTSHVAQQGEPGEKVVVYDVVNEGGVKTRKLVSERILKRPVKQIIIQGSHE